MIIDTLPNLHLYTTLNPLFQLVIDFLDSQDIDSLKPGHYEIKGDDVFLNVADAPIKTREQAKLESHQKMIDIQIPITGIEEHGWKPLSSLPNVTYDIENDISFYKENADIYYNVKPGQFVIYFPQDGHAPAITFLGLRKLIFKVKA